MRDQIETGIAVHPLSVCSASLGVGGGLSHADEEAFFALPYRTLDIVRGEEIVGPGDPARVIHVVLEGWVMRSVPTLDGRRQILSVALPGDILGLNSLAVGRSDYAASGFGAVRLAAMKPGEFSALLAKRPALRDCVDRLRAMEALYMRHQILRLGRLNAKGRIAHFLWEIHERLSRVGLVDNDELVFPMTQTDLSDTLGLSLVHTNRQLQALRRDKLITLRRDRLTIHEPHRLRQVAEYGGD